ncbi:MAG: hypothetical protein Kow00107_07710 [Planctomycetota bacterium]
MYAKVVEHPLSGFAAERAKREMQNLSSPKTAEGIDENIISAYAAYKKELSATPTPSPTPVATPTPSATVTPTAGPETSATPAAQTTATPESTPSQSPEATPAVTPTPVDINP